MENTSFRPKCVVERSEDGSDRMLITIDKESASLIIEATSYSPADIDSECNIQMLQACREILRRLAFASLNVKVPELRNPSDVMQDFVNSI